jgi:hypothetical protein
MVTKPLVCVVWHDAEDSDSERSWLTPDEVETFSTHDCTIRSVGYLESKTAKYVTLSADLIDETEHRGRVTKIPTGMIVSIERLIVEGPV